MSFTLYKGMYMKTIKILLVSALLLSSTPGYCSYLREFYEKYGDNDVEFGGKCYLLIDLIKTEKNKERKKHYQRELEIHVLTFLDSINYKIEYMEQSIKYSIEQRDKATTKEEKDFWKLEIFNTENTIKQREAYYSKIEQFLKYT